MLSINLIEAPDLRDLVSFYLENLMGIQVREIDSFYDAAAAMINYEETCSLIISNSVRTLQKLAKKVPERMKGVALLCILPLDSKERKLEDLNITVSIIPDNEVLDHLDVEISKVL